MHLFTEDFYKKCMPAFEEAEMLRLPLEKTILNVKLLFSGFGAPTELLAQSLSPPPQHRILGAVNSLYMCGALASADETSAITYLGKLAAHMPIDLPLVKLVLLGIAFNCCTDAIVMAAALSLQDIFLMPSSLFIRNVPQYAAELAANLQARAHFDQGKYSEPLAYLSAYKAWLVSKRTVQAARALGLSHSRAAHLDLLVADLANRALMGVENQVQHSQLETLRSCARKRGVCKVDELDGVFSHETDLLRIILAGACAPNFLTGSVKTKGSNNSSSGEFAGNRTVLINNLAQEFKSQSQLQKVLDPLCLKVAGFKLLSGGKAQIELKEAPELKDWVELKDCVLSGKGSLEAPLIDDTCISAKFITQLLISYRQKLFLPNPNHCPGSDAPPEVMLGTVALGSRVTWRFEGLLANTYWRSPLGVMCSLKETNLEGVAFSILAGGESSGSGNVCNFWAEGVTVFKTPYQSKVFQFIFCRRSKQLRLTLKPIRSSSGRICDIEITSFQCDDKASVSFEPYSLNRQDLISINDMCTIINGIISHGHQKKSLNQTRAATSNLQRVLLREKANSPSGADPVSEQRLSVSLSLSHSDIFIPLIDISLLISLAEEAARLRHNAGFDATAADSSKLDSDTGLSHQSYEEKQDPKTFTSEERSDQCKETLPSGQRQAASLNLRFPPSNSQINPSNFSAPNLSVPQGVDSTARPGETSPQNLLIQHIQAILRTEGRDQGMEITKLNATLAKTVSSNNALRSLVRSVQGTVTGLGKGGAVSQMYFKALPSCFTCRPSKGGACWISLPERRSLAPATSGAAAGAAAVPPQPVSASQRNLDHPASGPGAPAREPPPALISSDLAATEAFVADRIRGLVAEEAATCPSKGVDLTRINELLRDCAKGREPELRRAISALRSAGSKGLGKTGTVRKEFFQSRPAMFEYRQVGMAATVSLVPTAAQGQLPAGGAP